MTDQTPDPGERVGAQVESVLRTHVSDIEGILIRMGFPRHVAVQAVNDAFLAFWRQLRKGVPVENPKAFLVKIATNRAISALRPLREKNEIPGSDRIGDLPNRTDDFTVAVMIQMDIRRGLGQLSLRQRAALTLCHLCDLTHEEAGKLMGISAAGVESNLRRGRERLKQIMLEQGYQPRNQGKGDLPRKEETR